MSSIKIRTKRLDGKTQLRTLISHPMETGRNRDPKTQQLIPAHYIETLNVSRNDKLVVSCALGASISKDPYFAFMLTGGKEGDKITITWLDNLGNRDEQDHVVR